jgi:hypothetical protein
MDTAENGHPQQLPCLKYNRYQDIRDPRCSDPELYCKYRTSCMIHFMQKNNERQTEDE